MKRRKQEDHQDSVNRQKGIEQDTTDKRTWAQMEIQSRAQPETFPYLFPIEGRML